MEEAPANLKTISIIQLVSGLLNIFVMAGLSWFVLGMGAGTITLICTLGFCPFGGFLGFLGCLLIPIGISEVAVGAMGLSDPMNAAKFSKYAAVLELASFLCGGIPSAIAGVIVLYMLRDDEIVAYIEANA